MQYSTLLTEEMGTDLHILGSENMFLLSDSLLYPRFNVSWPCELALDDRYGKGSDSLENTRLTDMNSGLILRQSAPAYTNLISFRKRNMISFLYCAISGKTSS